MKWFWARFGAWFAGVILAVAGLSLLPVVRAQEKKPPEKRFLIVAPNRFHAALKEFVRHKEKLLPTELVSLEDVLKTSPGTDDPERLKRFLFAAWKERHLGYVLLAGDVDVLPVRYMVLDRATPAAFDYAFYPSDLYYSDLARQDGTFDDWNARKDGFHAGYFGEVRGEKNKKDPINFDQIDYRPEVAVGRWPVSTPEEVGIVAAKSVAYEEAVRSGKHPGEHKATVFHVGGWVDARDRLDKLATGLPPGWQADRHFFRDRNPKFQTPLPDEKNVLATLNAGAGLVIHAGHGSEMTWEGCFSVAALAKVKNADRLPVVLSAGCSTAYFAPLPPYEAYVDVHGKEHVGTNKGEVFKAPPPPPAPYQKGKYNPTGLGEQLLKRGPDGAVVYIGCNTGSQPCGLTLLDGFVQAMGKTKHPRVGDCWASAVSYYYDKENLAKLEPNNDWYPPSIFFQGMKFMLFGDPTLPLAVPQPAAPVRPVPPPRGASLLLNPGFEKKLDDWERTVYGAESTVEPDPKVVHKGKQSLRISAVEPSDTALAQEVQLRPGGCYRLSAWVRTRQLDPRTAPVCGTLQVQRPGGARVIASGPSHQGDTDWTRIEVPFEAPTDGRARICIFFVGFGKGTGTAWFDDLKLEPLDVAGVPLRVTREPLYRGAINPLQYGQFVEYLCDLVPSMWAEKLYDGSFEGLGPYKVHYLKETDNREKPWYPAGATNRAEYVKDPTGPVGGRFAQKIAVAGGAPCTVGIAQDGLAIARDQPCVFHCYLRQEGVKGPVRVRVHRESQVYADCEFRPEGAWKKYTARLSFPGDDTNATLSITFSGPGTLWLDSASLMPEKTVGGWRPDVVAAVRALKPGVIRFGGSALDDPNLGAFDWRDTLGDPDRRRPFPAWGGLQPAGAGLEELVQFCQHVDAEPLLCVRVTGKTPKDAAEQVEYFNGPKDSPMGKLRAKNGHPAPYGVKFWQVGNEVGGADYEARLPAFCEAMKASDPSIKLLSSYPSEAVLKRAGQWLDYVCPHHYGCADLAGKANDLNGLRDLIRRHAPERPIKVAVTEWNTTAGDWGPRRAMLWTLDNALACARYHNLLHRHGDVAAIANRSNLINSFCSGIVQTDRHRLYTTPTYHAQLLYATLAGNRALKVESPLRADLGIDVSATLSAEGDMLTLFAVNATLEDVTRPLNLSAFGDAGQEADVRTLMDTRRAGEPDVTNSFAEPVRVVPTATKFRAASARFDYRFPALSLTVLRWKVR